MDRVDPRRLRLFVLVAGLLAAALVLGSWTQPWFAVVIDDREIVARGQDAAPALSGIALAAVALLAALMIARRHLRIVLGVVLAALGVLAVVVAAPLVLSDAAALMSMAPVIAEATGIAGFVDQSITRTAWPIVALLGGLLATLSGIAVATTAGRWPIATSKYDAEAAKADTSTGAWDALSDGDDPTTR